MEHAWHDSDNGIILLRCNPFTIMHRRLIGFSSWLTETDPLLLSLTIYATDNNDDNRNRPKAIKLNLSTCDTVYSAPAAIEPIHRSCVSGGGSLIKWLLVPE